MKKLMVGAVALIVAVLGFGSLTAPTTQANPLTMYVVNTNVAAALAGMTPTAWATALTTSATTRATISSGFAAAQAASGGQLNSNMSTTASAGDNWVIVVTNDSTQTIVLNGRGLVCSATAPSTPCDNTTTQLPNTTDKIALWNVTAIGSFPGGVVTATQAGPPTSLDSTALTVAGAPHDLQLAVLGTPAKTTVQEGATSCSATASSSSPSVGTAQATYVDINGKALVGLNPTFKSAATANMAIGSASAFPAATNSRVTMVNADKSISAQNAFCGVAASTGVTLTVSSSLGEAPTMGVASGTVDRTQKIVVTGVPAAIALTASPAAIACDGSATSTVTAKVTDSAGNNVVDNTPVTFSVVALGTANPIQTSTKAGSASSTITPLSGSVAGATVIVTSGSVQSSIRVDCIQPTPTTPPAPVATPTKVGGGTIGAPNTGTGGYLGQDSTAGFPLWTLIALGLGSVALVAGGMVTRRAGK